jgi:uncharacterized protein (DUF2126 family)/transglutaminase-like putative cysteine protease
MAIRVAIRHQTFYRYDNPVTLSPHVFRLRPAAHSRTPIEAYSIKVKPEKHFINWQQDPFGNYLARVVFTEPARELSVDVELIADMTVINPFEFFVEEYADLFPFEYDPQLKQELLPYLDIRENGPRLKAWLALIDASQQNAVDFLVDLNRRLHEHIAYSIRMEPGVQTCEETLEKKLGSCRDSAWLLVQVLRHLGLAARFVSGYLVQLTADVKSLDGPSGPEQDFTDLHAWTEVYIPGAGWVGLDATSGLFAGEGHIPLACTPDPVSAAPITGGFIGEAECEFDFDNSVTRVHEDPRVTKPYSESQWQAIEALGHEVDAVLEAGDVRLTMGGEPTFVSIDDMQSAQWNTDADGPHKRERAGVLVRRLQNRFSQGGVRHYGQGKWYPGEPLPRWLMATYWRNDGLPIWHNQRLLAEETADYGVTVDQAAELARKIAEKLKVHIGHVLAGYEDAFWYCWKEGSVPGNIDPLSFDLKDPIERKRLARILDRGLNLPAGYALPLAWNYGAQCWHSALWTFRREEMFLVPGDSPMGLRLPIDALPWIPHREHHQEHSLFDRTHPLRDSYREGVRRYDSLGGVAGGYPSDGSSPDAWAYEQDGTVFDPAQPGHDAYGEVARRFSIRVGETAHPAGEGIHPQELLGSAGLAYGMTHTALCVEPREGRMHVFLPPLTHLEHYLSLLAAIESAAEECGIPVILEGYEPPRDPRLVRLLVTPDPGVIEVNIHPSASWDELVDKTVALYEEAHLSRLGTEKFMLDGRHTGTGGGNHVTLGGATPADSPLLRRPDLLRSLITYWQHHPALSYLFSGMFIGPTSQAPRVDEGRDEMLYELEIAFNQTPKGITPAPWLVDRLLRNLLVDVTGNTHRSEFCIDKLYSPDSATGRLGLLELRAFEMPPHAHMSLMQMLLLRTLVAKFWNEPYEHKLVRWGTELHDRFLLPHYVAADMAEVVEDLNRAGYAFDKEWIAPFLEFRFPHYGTIRAQNLELELRFAIEPWHVLGEETTSFGTARYVDSSVERLQVRIDGMTDSRYALACNGRHVPLRNTGKRGEFVGGVRYRAWQPPSALHPNIGVHVPLVLDIIDLWNDRSIGGCTYFVDHPGGRNYATYPVNAYEAEARRVGRFWNFGHTPGTHKAELLMADQGYSLEFPYTLDLRRPSGL